LRQVFLNLLLNAIQQMAAIRRHGSIDVEIAYETGQEMIQVRIRDDGPGIHSTLWERIFDFGFTTRKGGAGLGLTISREIVSKLRGTLSVEESHMLWGTTFLLELPTGA
jgi:signal transduction histidine kinase